MGTVSGYDDLIRSELSQRGYRLAQRPGTGLRADPPAVRIQLQPDGSWLVLDVQTPLATAADRPAAIEAARVALGRPGLVYVLDRLDMIVEVLHVAPKPAPPTPAGVPATPEHVAAAMGPEWMRQFRKTANEAKRTSEGDELAEKLAEAFHVLHPVLQNPSPILELLRHLAGF